MKIRIKDNSIRLRLTKTDVADLKSKQHVACKTVISNQEIFEYVLQSKDISEAKAAFSSGRITVTLPLAMASILTDTEEITVKSYQENGQEEPLFLLIEKDLQCLDETHEDQSDMYDNPKLSC
ncbi:MAG: hypothetical protein Q4G27_08875 [Flavobacteriaceae bacterium]|nr:hypothetical protein [Flavobacteriaceae bacterium]